MSRISIDVTPEEHARLKALAALQGKSIKEFVLASTLRLADEDGALAELEALLDSRLKNARAGGLGALVHQSVSRRNLGATADFSS